MEETLRAGPAEIAEEKPATPSQRTKSLIIYDKRKALERIREYEEDIVVTPGDEGNATVILHVTNMLKGL